jgi:hypothetical protein
LFEKIKHFSNINIVSNPEKGTMSDLIEKAHINLLWSFQAEGIKLKLFYALFQGRFVLSNENIVLNTGLEKFVFVVKNESEIASYLENIFLQSFDNQEIKLRKDSLEKGVLLQKTFLKEIFYKNNLF